MTHTVRSIGSKASLQEQKREVLSESFIIAVIPVLVVASLALLMATVLEIHEEKSPQAALPFSLATETLADIGTGVQ